MLPGVLALLFCVAAAGAQNLDRLAIDYPEDKSVFPPEFPAPTFLWRDNSFADVWKIEVSFADIGPAIQRLEEKISTRTWIPNSAVWEVVKKNSIGGLATITIIGFRKTEPRVPLSIGRVRLRTSADPVGSPIFYREVPLMPSETVKGVIKPLSQNALPLIAWKLREAGASESRVLMEGLHTCANCHSFSRDGKTMGMDVDGPQNDKGLYALTSVQPEISITKNDVVAWSTFRGKLGGNLRVGFMSQVSPDGSAVVTTINDPGIQESEYQRRKNSKEVALNYYVANFKDLNFLQVFFPTRGILAWYSRASRELKPLPGADNPDFVQTNAVWSPDGKYIVFARAAAKEPYGAGSPVAQYANDPNETQLQYDLYRIPFRNGQGGTPEPIAGASANGKSNTFPKISPDGKWIVYVQSRNGMLMRPDSELYIVPTAGGTARRMRCNTRLMNSWHSFSPNGRWMVFSSKSRSPYTQMYLTHLDENGNDSPAILIENATAPNRAVNLPEFVNIGPGGLLKMSAPVADFYRIVDLASDLSKQGRHEDAVIQWRHAVELEPDDAMAHNNLGTSLARVGREADAVSQFEKALALSPEYPEAHNNLGAALIRRRLVSDAIVHFEKAIQLSPRYGTAYCNLGSALLQQGRNSEAVTVLERAIEYEPGEFDSHFNLAIAHMRLGDRTKAIAVLKKANEASGGHHSKIRKLLSDLTEPADSRKR